MQVRARIVGLLAVSLVTGALLTSWSAPARAGAKLNIDYVDTEDYEKTGKFRVFADLLDDDYNALPGLDGDEVTVFIDDTEVPGVIEVETFQQANERIAVAILVAAHLGYAPHDTGEEEIQGDPDVLKHEREGFANFVAKLDDNDRVAVYVYDELSLRLKEDWRDAGESAAESIREIKPSTDDRTSSLAATFYKRVKTVVDEKIGDADGLPRRKILLLMSDGADKQPKEVDKNVKAIVEAARTHGVQIYVVALTLADRSKLAPLKSLTSKTGGVFREIKVGTDPHQAVTEVPAVIEAMAEELKKQYVLTFTPNDDFEGCEKACELRLEAKAPDGSNVEKDYSQPIKLAPPAFKWWLIFVWIGGVLAALGAIFGIFKLIKFLANREPAVVYVEEGYEGPYRGKLSVTGGPHIGAEFFLVEDVTTIGSISGNGVVLPSGGASKRHCGIHIDDMRFELADFGSTNKTLVNGTAITKQFLRDGDVIQIGENRLVFTLK